MNHHFRLLTKERGFWIVEGFICCRGVVTSRYHRQCTTRAISPNILIVLLVPQSSSTDVSSSGLALFSILPVFFLFFDVFALEHPMLCLSGAQSPGLAPLLASQTHCIGPRHRRVLRCYTLLHSVD